MALHILAARTRTLAPAAAAALRLSPAPRVSPPTGTVPRFLITFQGRPTSATKDVRMLYKENLRILNGFKNQERDIHNQVRTLKVGSQLLKWSFRLLIPIPLTATVLQVTH